MGKQINSETIVSLQNSKIKDIVRLRQRRHRDLEKIMIIDGVQAIRSAIKNSFLLNDIYYAETQEKADLFELAIGEGVKLQAVSEQVFNKISYGENTDGFLALAPQPPFKLETLPCPVDPFYIVLESLEKPGNIGAVLRSADASAVSGVIICDPLTDIYNPNVIRSSCGTLFTVPIAVAPESEVLEFLNHRKINIYAAFPDSAMPYTEIDWRTASAAVIGNEHSGLSTAWMKQPKVTIPMYGQVDSLNAAQTATIIMFENLRQRNLSRN